MSTTENYMSSCHLTVSQVLKSPVSLPSPLVILFGVSPPCPTAACCWRSLGCLCFLQVLPAGATGYITFLSLLQMQIICSGRYNSFYLLLKTLFSA